MSETALRDLLGTPPPSKVVVVYPAGEAVGGHRVVKIVSGEAFYADPADVVDAHLVSGVTQNAAVLGGNVRVQILGPMLEAAWSWNVEEPIYLGVNGVLTQVPAAGGALVMVAVPVAPDAILINVRQPIFLV
jgi:hypothetical protein